ncbi:MAG: hypothetical protein Harvfovirus19_20 [Harvfovirus sp.]|uniref:Uncharacterized protein n=1 Tax=Harvfovirus sp. TaxID=2487768 RepID=A0A3G5A1U6_9VIRU|nr:MAG: hypothetical protein Harvfovirus19_20 [Harvfovirus sp.]
MKEFSIDEAILDGLMVGAVSTLGSFTETDPHLSFHQIPSYSEDIALSLKWQSINIISEDFLSNELCYFVQTTHRMYFCLDLNKAKFSYYIVRGENSPPDENHEIVLAGPRRMTCDIYDQFRSRGFILWESHNHDLFFQKTRVKHGTFRKFFPNSIVTLFPNDELLCCEYNTQKGIHYLKLLRYSYLDRLAKVFDALPDVLLDIISSYALGEFLIEKLYW